MRITSGDQELAADLVEPEGGVRRGGYSVLMVHGYGSSRQSYLRRATDVARRTGHTCLVFDLRGHGDSPGELLALTREDHLRDVTAAYDALAEAPGIERIGVCAASYGAYLTCLLVADRPVDRLLLRAPALYVDTDGPEPSRQHLSQLLDAAPALRALRGFDGHTMVLEGERDEVISQDAIQGYLGTARHVTHRVLAGATHSLTEESWNRAFIDEIVDWFS
ncbi:alpha/beta fold hydrolase [Haloechinothrix sp. LS1_15]|uniref:alpha/beta hydrolase n=1 Tax=Haloechinothrix sp. LS1_15 TaxID=2652248 RepID=UPI00294A9C84|nr:alpha/beta fold hydrolase [Haloechinothrix sp. LS1_15]